MLINTRRVGWVGHIVCMGEKRTAYRGLVGKHTVEHTVYGMQEMKCTCRKYQK